MSSERDVWIWDTDDNGNLIRLRITGLKGSDSVVNADGLDRTVDEGAAPRSQPGTGTATGQGGDVS